jgi:hypothetical protein
MVGAIAAVIAATAALVGVFVRHNRAQLEELARAIGRPNGMGNVVEMLAGLMSRLTDLERQVAADVDHGRRHGERLEALERRLTGQVPIVVSDDDDEETPGG